MGEKNNKKAYILALIVAILWGSSAAISKLVIANLSFWNIQLYTLGFTSVFLFILILIQKKLYLLRFSFSDLFWMFLIGLLGKYLYGNLFYIAVDRLPAQEAFIINYLWPMMVVISAVFILKEKLTVAKALSLFFSLLAVIIVATRGDLVSLKFGDSLGVICAMLGALAYGTYSSLSKKRDYDPLIGNFMFTFWGFMLTLVTLPFFDSIVLPNSSQFWGIIWLGPILSLGAVLWLKALSIGETSKVSNIIYFTPFFSLIYISILLGERITLPSIVGLVILVASNLFSLIGKSQKSVS